LPARKKIQFSVDKEPLFKNIGIAGFGTIDSFSARNRGFDDLSGIFKSKRFLSGETINFPAELSKNIVRYISHEQERI